MSDMSCSIPTVIFTLVYTLINLVLYASTIYTLYKFCKDYKADIESTTPKMLTYSGFVFFVSSLIIMLIQFRNAMDICFHGEIDHLDITEWVYFIIFYGLQTYLLWLVLFFRLKYVFDGSEFSLSKRMVKICGSIFVCVPCAAPFYLIIMWFNHNGRYNTMLLSAPFVFIISFSCFLLFTFVYKLVQVFKTMDVDESTYNDTMENNKLLSYITKSTILAVVSLSMTVCTPISLLFGYYAISMTHNQTIHELGYCILAFFTLADVYTNYLCILVSYHCFHHIYTFMCSKCDHRCKLCCIRKMGKNRRNSRRITPTLRPDPGGIIPADGGDTDGGESLSNYNKSISNQLVDVEEYDDYDDYDDDDEYDEYVYQRNGFGENEYEQIGTEGQEDSCSKRISEISEINII